MNNTLRESSLGSTDMWKKILVSLALGVTLQTQAQHQTANHVSSAVKQSNTVNGLDNIFDDSVGVSDADKKRLHTLIQSPSVLQDLQRSTERGAFVRDFSFNYAAQAELDYLDWVVSGAPLSVYDEYVNMSKSLGIGALSTEALKRKLIDNDKAMYYLTTSYASADGKEADIIVKPTIAEQFVVGSYEYLLTNKAYEEQGSSTSLRKNPHNFYAVAQKKNDALRVEGVSQSDKMGLQAHRATRTPSDQFYHQKQVVSVVENLLKLAQGGSLNDKQADRLRMYFSDRVENGEVLQGYMDTLNKGHLYSDLIASIQTLDSQQSFLDILRSGTASFTDSSYHLDQETHKNLVSSNQERIITRTHDAFLNALRARRIAGDRDTTYLAGLSHLTQLTHETFLTLAHGDASLAKQYEQILLEDIADVSPRGGNLSIAFSDADADMFGDLVDVLVRNRDIQTVNIDFSTLMTKKKSLATTDSGSDSHSMKDYFSHVSRLLDANKAVVFQGDGTGRGFDWDKDGDPMGVFLITYALQQKKSTRGLVKMDALQYSPDELLSVFSSVRSRALNIGGFAAPTMNISYIRKSFSSLAKNNPDGIHVNLSSLQVVDDEFWLAMFESGLDDDSVIYLPKVDVSGLSDAIRGLVIDAIHGKLKHGPRVILGSDATAARDTYITKHDRKQKK